MISVVGLPRGRGSVLLALLLLSTGCGSLLSATRERDGAAVTKLLAKGADPNQASDDGQRPLCEAIAQGELEIVRTLVRAGAKVDAVCRLPNAPANYTPLELAAKLQRAAIVEHLLTNRADPFAKSGEDPLLSRMARATKGGDAAHITGMYLDHIALAHGREKMVEVANETAEGWTPLSAAAFAGDDEMVRQLLDRGVDPNSFAPASSVVDGSNDEWPVMFFIRVGDGTEANMLAVTAALVKAGAVPKPETRQGRTWEEAFAAHMVSHRNRRNAANQRVLAIARAERTERHKSERQQQAAWASRKPIANPVHDNTFQQSMANGGQPVRSFPSPSSPSPSSPSTRTTPRATASPGTASPRPVPRPTPEAESPSPPFPSPSPSPSPSSPSPSSPSPSSSSPSPSPSPSSPSGSASSTGHLVITPINEPSRPPPPPPVREARTPTPLPTATAKVEPTPPKPRECKVLPPREGTVGRTSGSPSVENAQGWLKSMAFSMCGAGGYAARDEKCAEHRQPRLELVSGKLTRVADVVTYGCTAYVVCAKGQEICKAGPIGASRQ